MRINKSNAYITKEEAILAMRKGKNKEESEWAIRSIPSTKVRKSLKVTPVFLSHGEEHCPHCRKNIEIYAMSVDVPKLCYCFWCGGAIYRPNALGKKNNVFDYKALTPEQVETWEFENDVKKFD